uniref:Uncharacterized protein n=1 Tax=Anguilla anguilla TaxID=7936 RepID=A0A0E9QXJ6_ANGAN
MLKKMKLVITIFVCCLQYISMQYDHVNACFNVHWCFIPTTFNDESVVYTQCSIMGKE